MKDTKKFFPDGFIPFDILSEKSPETPILVALSGGADSRMLFELTARYCRAHSSRFYACHVNHGIRGDEAIRDRDFCVRLASECDECADIFVLNADVPTLAKERGLGIEQCARHVRYEFFDKIMEENGISILATAHNADDNLETLVFNLTRGSGVRGMCGIPRTRSVKNGILVRPMLGIPKAEVFEFCEKNSLEYVTDSTNAQTEYTRNLIRAEVIPLLESINPSVRKAASRMTESMTELWSLTADTAHAYVSEDGSISLPSLKSADSRLLPYVFSLAADTVGIDLEGVHLDALKLLASSGKDGSSISLPGNRRAVIVGDTLLFDTDKRTENFSPVDIPLSEGEITLPCGKIYVENTDDGLKIALKLSTSEENFDKNINVYKLAIKAHIIFDKIKWSPDRLRLRTRREGDRILSRGMHKSVKKLMCDKKCPRAVRDMLPMLTCGDDILWIPTVETADGVTAKEIK